MAPFTAISEHQSFPTEKAVVCVSHCLTAHDAQWLERIDLIRAALLRYREQGSTTSWRAA